jgi:putative addiction module killer protein
MSEIIQSETFKDWRSSLKDRQAIFRINARPERVAKGNWGDVKPVGHGVSELRIDDGPGYRVYFMPRGPLLIVLSVGGNKRTQEADIRRFLVMNLPIVCFGRSGFNPTQ